MKAFLRVWAGQLASMMGSGLTGFALRIWAFQQSGGSTSVFALASLSVLLPQVVLSPLAGALVDRWDRRRVMVLSDAFGGLCTLAAALLLISGHAQLWSVCLLVALNMAMEALRFPAWTAATTLLVSADQLPRASGLVQMAQALTQLLAPLAAGLLVVMIGVGPVLLVDAGTFAFALLTLALVRFPPPQAPPEAGAGRGSLRAEMLEGWRYVAARSGLAALLLLDFALTFVLMMGNTALTPLVLAGSSPAVLGTLASAMGLGMLAGSLVLSAWKGPPNKVNGVLGFSALLGVMLALFGLLPVGLLSGVAAFGLFFCVPLINGLSQVIWQRKVTPGLQGRVFALLGMLSAAAGPLALLLLGPLVDGLFEPAMAPGGALAASAGKLLGVGPGRGIALLFVGLGLTTLGLVAVAALFPALRQVEATLPDAVDERLPGAGPEPVPAQQMSETR